MVTISLGEQILCNFVFKSYEILIKGVVLKANLITLEMHEVNVILGMNLLSTHRDSMDCFTKKIVFRKQKFPELEFVVDRRILPTCVISLEGKKITTQGL